jgi:uncharacterized protein (TIGR02246 family)
VIVLLIALSFAAGVSGQEPSRPSDANRALAEVLAAFLRAFNGHDAAAVAKLWKEDALHVAKDSDTRTAGRAAIQAAYAQLFKDDPKCVLNIVAKEIRAVTPNVVNLECIADVRHTNGDVSRSEFNALVVQRGSTWLIDQVHENDVPLFPAATENLSPLAWLVGNWTDDSKNGRVANETHWAMNGAFLVRNYQLEQNGAVARQGTQIIGWDAEHKCLRSWLFDGSGSFGEGTWQPEGDNKWVNKMVLKLPDGRRGSLDQVFQRAGDDKLTIETIDREIDGKAQPNGPPVSLVREGAQQTAIPSAAAKENHP